jgi:hypothetical protein
MSSIHAIHWVLLIWALTYFFSAYETYKLRKDIHYLTRQVYELEMRIAVRDTAIHFPARGE